MRMGRRRTVADRAVREKSREQSLNQGHGRVSVREWIYPEFWGQGVHC
jgi:hypothetical protein